MYIKREYVQKGKSLKLSEVFHDLSKVVEANHSIYKIQRVRAGGKDQWVHYNRLRKKSLFDDPNKKLKQNAPIIWQNASAFSYDDIDDDDWDDSYEYPREINNSNVDTAIPEYPTEGSAENDHHITEPVVFSETDEDVDAQVKSESQAAETREMGRQTDDAGRLLSTRTKKFTQSKDSQY